jgi:hypothetical protein
VIALRESPPVPAKPAAKPAVRAEEQRPRASLGAPVAKEQAPAVSFGMIFLSVLLVVLLLILMLAALVSVGNLLR